MRRQLSYRPALVSRGEDLSLKRLFQKGGASGRAASSETASVESIRYEYYPKRRNDPFDRLPRDKPFGVENLLRRLGKRIDFWYLIDEHAGKIRLVQSEDKIGDLLNWSLRVGFNNSFRVDSIHPDTGQRLKSSVRGMHDYLVQLGRLNLRFIDLRSDSNEFSVSLEAWRMTEDGHLSSVDNNRYISRLWAGPDGVKEPCGDMLQFLPAPTPETVGFEVDWVFTWVNGSDPDWKAMYEQWVPEAASDATDKSRFETRDDLKYALRSIDKYAPWVRKIHVLTNCKPPSWLRDNHPRINWVRHEEVFDSVDLPTFNSHSIETVIHKIPGLSENFVYSNDDFFLTRYAPKTEFFFSNGIARSRLENYGMVNGEVVPGQPDHLNAARNSSALLARDFSVYPVRLHTHSPQSLKVSVLREMEERYAEEFKLTRSKRFRDETNIAVTGFLYHHYAYLTGRAVHDGASTRLIQQNHDYRSIFHSIIKRRNSGKGVPYLSVCVNDGRGSADNEDWSFEAFRFVEQMYPEPSQFEK